VKASVIIPVKNGGERFREVLPKVIAQKTSWPFDVLVIDSGSRDGSLQFARGFQCRVEEIPPDSFGHGRTRNLGGSLTTGEFLVYITHDACPVNDYWLQNLVDAAEQAPDVAGAFGRHIAYPDASIVTEHELELHFSGFGPQSVIVRNDDPERYAVDVGYRQFLLFFSNNNSCLRRSVWERIPFPVVDFAEDQIWAKTVIEAGYAKAYSPTAVVYHSHDFPILETAQRAYDESRALHRLFGYVLVPSIPRFARDFSYLVSRDAVWVLSSRRSLSEKITALVKAPLLAGAKLTGRYFGAREARLPGWLARSFSRDKALQRG
jgi:rhamnosyltransferase